MIVGKQRVTCKSCNGSGDIEVVAGAPIDVWAASIKVSRCPHCGAGYRKLVLGGEISDDKPDITAPLNVRTEWWLRHGDVGLSSRTLYVAFMGGALRPIDQTVPCDPDDFSRCKKLLDLIPEWRNDLDAVKNKFPFWRPMVDNWGRLEELYAEGERIKWKGERAHAMYEFMRPLVNECDAMR